MHNTLVAFAPLRLPACANLEYVKIKFDSFKDPRNLLLFTITVIFVNNVRHIALVITPPYICACFNFGEFIMDHSQIHCTELEFSQ